MDINLLSKRFIVFANTECVSSSPLYASLSREIAKDHELLTLCMHVQTGQPVANLLFAAVQYTLNKYPDDTLYQYYPSFAQNPKAPESSFPAFKTFCLKYEEAIRPLLETKLVQTNEVRRCVYLYPTFSYIYQKTQKPLALIEIGTSAGLQLFWDRYHYAYPSIGHVGNTTSSVHLSADVHKGDLTSLISQDTPPVTTRIGLDLHINDPANDEDTAWLWALIWPEHHERRQLFEQAVAYVNNHRHELQLIEGNGVTLLADIAATIPQDTTLCVFHTHVANQMTKETRQQLLDTITHIGQARDIFHVYNNIFDDALRLDAIIAGQTYSEKIADTDAHGRFFSWYGGETVNAYV
ncbi:DUF2332 domain-containing protein [Bacillus sp. FSL W7-1360]